MISTNKKKKSAIASTLSAETYGLEVIQKNIENDKGNLTRFLVMGKNILQPELGKKNTLLHSFLNSKVNLLHFINHWEVLLLTV